MHVLVMHVFRITTSPPRQSVQICRTVLEQGLILEQHLAAPTRSQSYLLGGFPGLLNMQHTGNHVRCEKSIGLHPVYLVLQQRRRVQHYDFPNCSLDVMICEKLKELGVMVFKQLSETLDFVRQD